MSNSLDPDQARHFVVPDLGPNCLQRLSADNTSRQRFKTELHLSGVVTVQDSQSGKSFSLILNLAKNLQKSPIKCLKEQNIHRKQSVYTYLIVNT